MFFGFSNQPKRRGPPVVKQKMQPMSFSGMLSGNLSMGNPGQTKSKKNSMNKGDWDRDGVGNMFDCRPFNFRKQGPEHEKKKKSDLINAPGTVGHGTKKYNPRDYDIDWNKFNPDKKIIEEEE